MRFNTPFAKETNPLKITYRFFDSVLSNCSISIKETVMRRFFVVFLSIVLLSSFKPTMLRATCPNNAGRISMRPQQQMENLGLIIKMPDAETLKKLNIEGGAEVVRVQKGSAAQKAGLLPHDIILKFNGDAIANPQDLKRSISTIDEPKTVDVVVNRDGKELILTAAIKPNVGESDRDWDEEDYGYHWPGQMFGSLHDSLPDYIFQMMPYWRQFKEKGGYLGVVVEDLTDQLLHYFKADNGVLIKKVLKNSPAEKAGLKAGDVIYKINDKKIEDTADLMRTIQFYDPGNSITVYFVRNGKKKALKVTLGRKPKQEGWRSVFPQFWFNPERFPRYFQKPFLPPRFEQTPQERSRGIYKF